jgi:hypothetical protein
MFDNVKVGVRDCTVSQTVTSNKSFERTVKHGGPRLAAASCPAAQLGR